MNVLNEKLQIKTCKKWQRKQAENNLDDLHKGTLHLCPLWSQTTIIYLWYWLKDVCDITDSLLCLWERTSKYNKNFNDTS